MKRLQEINEEQYLLCNETNRELLEDFLSNSTELSEKTLIAYKSNLKIWLNYIREFLGNKNQTDIKPREYLRYQNWLLSLEHSSSDIANKRSAISTFNNYIVIYYADEFPTFRNFINKSIKKPEKSFVNEKIPPTRKEIQMMVDELRKSDRKDKLMIIAYILFSFSTGCRRAEIMQIKKDIIDTEPIIKTVKIKNENGTTEEKQALYYLTPKIRCKGRGKTGKIRQLRFGQEAMDAMKEWVMSRDDDCPYMFVSHPNNNKIMKQASESTINDWCTNILQPIIGRRIHPHAFREGVATDIVINQNKSIEAARSLLGHESSETTKIYVISDDIDNDSDELFI